MSETNFTEQDRAVLMGSFGVRVAHYAQLAIAEIDSLRAKLTAAEQKAERMVEQVHVAEAIIDDMLAKSAATEAPEGE